MFRNSQKQLLASFKFVYDTTWCCSKTDRMIDDKATKSHLKVWYLLVEKRTTAERKYVLLKLFVFEIISMIYILLLLEVFPSRAWF